MLFSVKTRNTALTLSVVSQTAKTNRPSKRQGGGGFGYFKSMNSSTGGKRDDKTRTYRQPKPKPKYAGKRDTRQFAR